MMRVLVAAAFTCQAAFAGCVAIHADQIRLRDLSQDDKRFEPADPDQAVGYAPAPGATRVFWPAELVRLAGKYRISTDAPFHPICFERSIRMPTQEEILRAIAEWTPPGTVVEIKDQSKVGVPEGAIVVPQPVHFRSEQDGTTLLRGFVRFGAGQQSPFWVRVRAHVKLQRVVAAKEISGMTEIQPEQIRVEEFEGGLEGSVFAASAEEVIGRTAKRRFLPGSAIAKDGLAQPRDVRRGARVHVDVRGARLHLAFEGLADGSGNIGQMIKVRNPSSGKAFTAEVTGENTVLVTTGAN